MPLLLGHKGRQTEESRRTDVKRDHTLLLAGGVVVPQRLELAPDVVLLQDRMPNQDRMPDSVRT